MLNPEVFLGAAEELHFADGYACVAIGRACKEKGLPHQARDSEERQYFAATFLDGDEFTGDATLLKFSMHPGGHEAAREHRILSLLFCYAMLSNP